MSNRIGVVGAGLTGSLLTLYLVQRGFEVDLYEKRPDMRTTDIPGGRTIVMSLSHRGLRALDNVGLKNEVLATTFPKHSRAVHLCDGSVRVQQYGKCGDAINTVDRKELNCLLMNRAEATGKVRLFFDHHCQELDPDSGRVVFLDENRGETVEAEYRAVIGSDGIFSHVRAQLEQHRHVDGQLIETGYGYRELNIPPCDNGSHKLEKHHVHVWPRQSHVLVALPRHDGRFCCNLFLPSEGERSLASMTTRESVQSLFNDKFPNVVPLMPSLLDEWFASPPSNISAVKCLPWHYKDKVLLIGDAAHAIVPFFAMGMNVGFEDCRVFDDLMDEYDNDLGRVFDEMSRQRKPNTDAIADLSYKNFFDIGRSPDPDYQVKWEVQRQIWQLRPDRWMPLYAMIAFSDTPLAETIARNAHQKRIVGMIIAEQGRDIVERPDALKNVLDRYLVDIEPLCA